MSGGSLDYLAYKIEEIFQEASIHYSNLNDKNECIYARVDDPMNDADVSEMLFDMGCLLHSLEWYLSGDNCSETYYKHLSEFKAKWINKENEYE